MERVKGKVYKIFYFCVFLIKGKSKNGRVAYTFGFLFGVTRLDSNSKKKISEDQEVRISTT